MNKGIIRLYYSFLDHLKREREKIAVLQLAGGIEDYLVKEFVYHTFCTTQGRMFALTNLGSTGKKEGKIDISMIAGDVEKPVIFGLIEMKCLRNRNRIWDYDARDEHLTALKILHGQTGPLKAATHGGCNVQLSARSKNIYGLIFASYVTRKNEHGLDKKKYYDVILGKAGQLFRYHDQPKPYFRPIFDGQTSEVLNSTFYVSLKAGLWRSKDNEARARERF